MNTASTQGAAGANQTDEAEAPSSETVFAAFADSLAADADLLDRQYRGWAGHLHKPAERAIAAKRAAAELIRAMLPKKPAPKTEKK